MFIIIIIIIIIKIIIIIMRIIIIITIIIIWHHLTWQFNLNFILFLLNLESFVIIVKYQKLDSLALNV